MFRFKRFFIYCTQSFSIFALVILVSGFVHFFVIEPSQVRGQSMLDTLLDGETVLIEKFTALFAPLKRGQIVSVYDARNDILLVKRIIGLPGEQIIIQNNEVYIIDKTGNRFKLDEPYLRDGMVTLPKNGTEAIYPVTDDNYYFILGDNRPHSRDSRYDGAFHRADIIGKVSKLKNN